MSDNAEQTPAALIDARIAELADWRGETLATIRSRIKQADPDVGPRRRESEYATVTSEMPGFLGATP
jgi:hypothetical protein